MKSLISSVIALLAIDTSAVSQESNIILRQPNSTIGSYVELGGFINIISINLDYQYTYRSDENGRDQIGIRGGYGLFLYNLKTIPALIVGSHGDNHRFEYGLGAMATPFGIPDEINLSTTLLKPSASVGWRFEQTGGGWLVRGVVTGVYDTGNKALIPLFGISIGANFQFR